jgi:hypothetical protein
LALAGVLGAAVCSFKPVYAPLLLLGYPTLVKARGVKYATLVHGGLLVYVREGVDASAQLSAILTHPLSYARVLVNTQLRRLVMLVHTRYRQAAFGRPKSGCSCCLV